MRTLCGDLSRSPPPGNSMGLPVGHYIIGRLSVVHTPKNPRNAWTMLVQPLKAWTNGGSLPAKYLDNRVHAKCVDKCPPEQYLPPMRIPLLRLPVDART